MPQYKKQIKCLKVGCKSMRTEDSFFCEEHKPKKQVNNPEGINQFALKDNFTAFQSKAAKYDQLVSLAKEEMNLSRRKKQIGQERAKLLGVTEKYNGWRYNGWRIRKRIKAKYDNHPTLFFSDSCNIISFCEVVFMIKTIQDSLNSALCEWERCNGDELWN